MAGFNPFAPQQKAQGKAPQLQGVQAPNVAMQEQPSMMQSLAPTVAQKAMDSDAFGATTDYLKGGVKDAWSALTSPANPVAPAIATAAPNASMIGTMGGTAAAGAGASLAPAIATAAPTAAMIGTMGGTAAAGAGASLAAAAPAAAALGPLGIPLIIGAGLLASGEGK